MTADTADLTRPIVGIENRTAAEVFDIMCNRIRRAPCPSAGGQDDIEASKSDLCEDVRRATDYGVETSKIALQWRRERDEARAALPARAPDGWSAAAGDVFAERRRQVSVEGWTPEHDDEHDDGSLALAAACYAQGGHLPSRFTADGAMVPSLWPQSWHPQWWKPSTDRRRDLVKAGALILAEIERLDRAAMLSASPPPPEQKEEKKPRRVAVLVGSGAVAAAAAAHLQSLPTEPSASPAPAEQKEATWFEKDVRRASERQEQFAAALPSGRPPAYDFQAPKIGSEGQPYREPPASPAPGPAEGIAAHLSHIEDTAFTPPYQLNRELSGPLKQAAPGPAEPVVIDAEKCPTCGAIDHRAHCGLDGLDVGCDHPERVRDAREAVAQAFGPPPQPAPAPVAGGKPWPQEDLGDGRWADVDPKYLECEPAPPTPDAELEALRLRCFEKIKPLIEAALARGDLDVADDLNEAGKAIFALPLREA